MTAASVLILGIGNILWADDGFGVRAVELLHRTHRFPDEVHLLDGGTQGTLLLPYVEAAERLLVFDAVDFGLAPGSLRLVRDGQVPRYMGAKRMSLHQTGFQDVLALAELLGRYPRHLALVGVQPQTLEDYGGSLSPPVRAMLEPAVECGLQWLAEQGVPFRRRDAPLPQTAALTGAALCAEAYEAGRPSAEQAPRVGDPRVLARRRRIENETPQSLGPAPEKGD